MSLLDRVNNLTNQRALIIGIVLAGMYYGMFYESGDTQLAQIAQSRQQIQSLNLQIEKLQKAEEDARRYKIVVAEMGERLDLIAKYIPEQLSDYQLMSLLSSEAKAAGANISNVTSIAPKDTGEEKSDIYEKVTVQVNLGSSYKQLMLFLSNLSQVDKIVSLDEMEIQISGNDLGDAADAQLSFKGMFTGYKYLPTPTQGSGQ